LIKPNLFILGAPKSGTTSLYAYLQKHPDIYFPHVKEPHYFAKDLPSRISNNIVTESDYLSLFKSAYNYKYIGEASVWYLYSDLAIEHIINFNPTIHPACNDQN